MKQLLLMRHAKSDHQLGRPDFERPLNKRGNAAAEFMGEFLKNKDLVPDKIFSSPAVRAKTTAQLFAENAGYKDKITKYESFYFGYRTELLETLKSCSDSVNRLMIVGHNPTWSDLSGFFSRKYVEMPTACIVILELKVKSWKDLSAGTCKLLEVLKPKNLMG